MTHRGGTHECRGPHPALASFLCFHKIAHGKFGDGFTMTITYALFASSKQIINSSAAGAAALACSKHFVRSAGPALGSQAARFASNVLVSGPRQQKARKVKGRSQDFYDSSALLDHMEHLDNMITRSSKLWDRMEELRRKKEIALQQAKVCTDNHGQGVHWVEPESIDPFIRRTATEAALLRVEFEEFRKVMDRSRLESGGGAPAAADATTTTPYAVDSPDGSNDGDDLALLGEVEGIFEASAANLNSKERSTPS